MFTSTLVLLLTAVVGSIVYIVLYAGRREKGLPPGPPTLPLIGNLHQLPLTGAHFKFTEWAKQYGGIYSLKLGTGTALVITDREIVKRLLDKKSSIYSFRPPSYVSHDLITGGDHLLVMQYNDTWRQFRKMLHKYFMESMCEKKHIVLQNAESTQLMHDFLVKPEGHLYHTKRYPNSIITTLLFGIRTPTYDTSHAKELYEIMEKWSAVMETGATPPVDIYPIFKYLPERFFGNWISRSKEVGRDMNALYSRMVNEVISRRSRGIKKETFMDGVLDEQEKTADLTPHQLWFLGGVLMEGGSDTSMSILITFQQAMVHWPNVQKKAQEEIDRVLDSSRSPTWEDFEKLPYVNMIIKECHRWRPVTPLSFPHALSEDDTLDNYRLPRGSTVILNVWGLDHDDAVHSQPEQFIPERFENQPLLAHDYAASSDWKNRDHYGYGAGRRICPGIHLAERGLFLAMAKLLWAFEFKPKVRADGTVSTMNVDPLTGYTEGFLHCAKPFECDITVRSEKKMETIEREFVLAQEVFKRYTE